MFYTLQLNAKLRPFDRHDLEDLIDEFLSEENLGNTSGGGHPDVKRERNRIL
ncbi:hypothetical protein [Capnocytophaga gingivalis]